MVRLETGDTGVAVTADSDGALYSGMFGVDNYVVATGNKFKAEIQSNNKIKISDGSAIMNGRHIRVPTGDSELVTINNGSHGMNRIDLIVFRYKKELTGVESGSLAVIQGEETASEPKVPDHVKGNILTGATQAEFPLYEVKLEGINITDIKPLFQTIGNITELEKKFTELNKDLSELSAYEKITLKDGVHLTRYGKLRILSLVNASSPTAGDIVRLPSEDTPSNYVMSAASLRGQTRGDFFISITPNNAVPPGKVGLFLGNNTAQSASGGYIVACVVWCVP